MTLSKKELARRLRAHEESKDDEEAAKILGISVGTWRWWRLNRKLPAKWPFRCRACGKKMKRKSAGEARCSRCRDAVESARTRRWAQAPFREYVRSLDGLHVSLKYSVQHPGVHGAGFRWARGALHAAHRDGRVRIGVVRVGSEVIPGTRIIAVFVDWKGEHTCACGCGETLVLRYNPHHGPPFFKAGHLARIRGKLQPGAFPKGHPSWSKGLKGQAWHDAYAPDVRAQMLKGLQKGRATMNAAAKGYVAGKDGYVLVATEEWHKPYHTRGRLQRARKMVPRARVVMAKVLGRPLRADEVVTHLNAVRNDDRPENLAVLGVQDKGALQWGMSVKKLRGEELLEYVRSVRERIEKECPRCKTRFDVSRNEAGRRIYCSRRCQHLAGVAAKPARTAKAVQSRAPSTGGAGPGPSRVRVPARRSGPTGERAVERVVPGSMVPLAASKTAGPGRHGTFCPTCGQLKIKGVCGCNVDRSRPAPVPRGWARPDEGRNREEDE